MNRDKEKIAASLLDRYEQNIRDLAEAYAELDRLRAWRCPVCGTTVKDNP